MIKNTNRGESRNNLPMKRLIVRAVYPLFRIYWYLVRPNTYGVKVVVEKNGKIFLVRHSYQSDYWSFPGGGKKYGETLEETGRREIKEETNLTLDSIEYIGSFQIEEEYKHDHVYVYRASTGGDPKIDGVEIIEFLWHDPKETLVFLPFGRKIMELYEKSI